MIVVTRPTGESQGGDRRDLHLCVDAVERDVAAQWLGFGSTVGDAVLSAERSRSAIRRHPD